MVKCLQKFELGEENCEDIPKIKQELEIKKKEVKI